MLKWSRWIGPAILILTLVFACSTERTLKPNANLPPETHLYLQFSDTLQLPGVSTSMQVLYWYGDDADGSVAGFEWTWDDTSAWTYTTDVMDTFYVPIRVPLDTFTFYIRAIDNAGMKDPTPSHISFPIRNSNPTVAFPVDFVRNFSTVTYKCFSYFSISWRGSDPDGDATITGYDWYFADSSFEPALTDTSVWNNLAWNHLDSLATLEIFNDLQPGSYRFYIRCKDVAGAHSPIISYPGVDSLGHALGSFRVMPKNGTVLFVDDDRYATISDSIINTALDEVCGPDGYSIWNTIDRISYYPRDIEQTLRLFDKVIWHGGSYPHFRQASDAISNYLGAGGHLLAISAYNENDTTIYPFLPLDSMTVRNILYRSMSVSRAVGVDTTLYPAVLSTPRGQPLFFSIGFRPAAPAALLPRPVEPLYWQMTSDHDSAIVAARFPAAPDEAQVIYFSMHLYDCTDQFIDLMRNILTREFENAGY